MRLAGRDTRAAAVRPGPRQLQELLDSCAPQCWAIGSSSRSCRIRADSFLGAWEVLLVPHPDPQFVPYMQEIKKREGTISIKQLSDITAIKADDIISTLNHLNLIQYQKGQHVIFAAPKAIEKCVSSPKRPVRLTSTGASTKVHPDRNCSLGMC